MWELDHEEGWALKKWCFWTVVLVKTLESPLDSKEIQPVSPKGNQPWIFIGRTDAESEASVLWLSDMKKWFTGKDLNAGKDWGQKEKGATEDEMVGWSHQLMDKLIDMSLSKLWETGKDRGAWWADVYGVAQSRTRLKWLSSKETIYWGKQPST